MNHIEKALMRWLHPFVFATWTLYLIYFVASQRYVAFLRPEFGFLLAIAHFIAMGFMIAAMTREKTSKLDSTAVLRSLVLMVPVIYSMVMPDTMLGNLAFKKRFVGTANNTISPQAPDVLSSQESEIDSDPSPLSRENSGIQQEAAQEPTILALLLNPELYRGKKVIVTGMFVRDEKLKAHFGGKDTAVFRFMIKCCAADALPLAIALDADQTESFANDQWVQVDGIFDLHQMNGKLIPMFSNPRIEATEAPAIPYLF